MLGLFGTIFDLVLVILGFGLIVFFHELGHFVAARWAGIRVLAFAMGIGPPLLSYRPGLGWRKGSSEPDVEALKRAEGEGLQRVDLRSISPTEYRLCWLPFGGYVKMLGQEDLHPEKTNAEPDSYQSVPVWKRLVVISAGVAMNVVLAAALFVLVFLVGLKTEPPAIGGVSPGSPASRAIAAVPGIEPGLKAGDAIASINGREPNSFNDLILASAMARRGEELEMTVRRAGVPEPIPFLVKPEQDQVSGLMMIGVEPARSATLFDAAPEDAARVRELFDAEGLVGVEPGTTLIRVGDHRRIVSGQDLVDAVRQSGGNPVEAEFARIRKDGELQGSIVVRIQPVPALVQDRVPLGPGELAPVEHVLGLVPVIKVGEDVQGSNKPAHAQGLRDGDIFARLGTLEFPSIPEGIAEVRRHRGRTIPVSVLRDGRRTDTMNVEVSDEGRIGFLVGDTGDDSALLADPLEQVTDTQGKVRPTAAAALHLLPGSRVLSVNGTPVGTIRELQAALRDATRPDSGAAFADTTVRLTMELPLPPQAGSDRRPVETAEWALTADDVRRLHEPGWDSRVSIGLFKPTEFSLKAKGPLGALVMGLEETRRVMLMTYVTFARLFEGTVKVEHLKGPVGIAHLGTRIADRGLVWLLFFMGLISVNLAVVNFLPLPIVDGGQFLFLLYEGLRGKPVSPAIQSAATALGLLLIGAVFLIVTFNDIAALFG